MDIFMRPTFFSLCLMLGGIGISGNAVAVETIPVEKFLALNQFEDIKLSPTGEFLAATLPAENRTVLVILRRDNLSVTGKVVLEEKAHVKWFDWVNDKRVLFTAAKKQGRLSSPRGTRGVFSVNADGSGQGRVDNFSAPSTHFDSYYVLAVLDTLRYDDNRALVLLFNDTWNEYQVARMNVNTGKLTEVPTRAPGKNVDFYSDNKGDVRFATSLNEFLDTTMYYRESESKDWTVINNQQQTSLNVEPIAYSADGVIAYLKIEEETGPDAVYEFNTVTKERKLLFKDDTVDPEFALSSPLDGGVYAIRYLDGIPKYRYVNPENPYAKVLRGMQASFPGAAVVPTSFTKDGNLGLYYVYSDTNSGDYYLYDLKTKDATYLASGSPDLDPDLMSNTKPVKFTARDNMPLNGLLTLPKGSDGKNLPLVINVHGGPFGEADEWGLDREVQLLANRGYAVLQVNFRGSGNHGRNFEVSGYGQWGGAMQDDLTDATKWAIAQGLANPKRICIYGASYGAYAALMGAVKEPNLYACAVGNVGVYDLAKTYTDGAADSNYGKARMDRWFGSSATAANSPNKMADKIQIPVLLAAGDEDDVAPVAHSRMMNDALKRLNKPVELVIYEKEGHGNYLMKNRLDFANRLLAFLDRNIGSGSQAK